MLDCRCIFFQRFWCKGSNGWERNTSYWKRINCRFWSSSQQCHLQQFVIQFIVTFCILKFFILGRPILKDWKTLLLNSGYLTENSRQRQLFCTSSATMANFDFFSIFFSIVLIDFNVAPILTFRPDFLNYTEGHPSSFLNGWVTIRDVNDLNMTG